MSHKVDKVNGKGLSTNDFTDQYKAYVDKVPSLESAVGVLNRGSNKKVYDEGDYNIGQCLDSGVYLYANAGRPSGHYSDENFIVDVDTRFNRSDSRYHVTQWAYSVNYPGRAFVRTVITDSLTNY